MKYIYCEVLVGIEDEVWDTFSESSDIAFHGVRHLHIPEKGQYLLHCADTPCPTEYVNTNKYNVFNEAGGI